MIKKHVDAINMIKRHNKKKDNREKGLLIVPNTLWESDRKGQCVRRNGKYEQA